MSSSQYSPVHLPHAQLAHVSKNKVWIPGQVAHQAGAYLRFLMHEATRSISTPTWMVCQSIAGIPPALNLRVSIYTPGWREAL